MIYLNSASTTFVKPEVIDVIANVLKNNWHNSNDISEDGRVALGLLEDSRKIIADFINANPNEIIFTSSGSMSNALAMNVGYHQRVLTTQIEHSSIMNNPKCICNIPVDRYGYIKLDRLEDLIKEFGSMCKIISIQMCSNEIGTIQNVKEIANICHSYNKILHVDATQYIPYYKVNTRELNVDMLSFSGHKLYAPNGIAVLYVRDGVKLKPLIPGSQHQEKGLIAGTQNIAYACGLAKAVQMVDYSSSDKIRDVRNYLYEKLCDEFKNKIDLNGVSLEERSCNNLNVRFNEINNQQLIALLEMEGCIVSAGSACNAYSIIPSRTLLAIGLTQEQANSSIRITLSAENTKDEMDIFADKLKKCINLLRVNN